MQDNKGKNDDDSSYSLIAAKLRKLRLYQERQKQLANYQYEKNKTDELEEELREAKELENREKRREKLKLIEYEITYELMKFEKKEIFNRKGEVLEKFNIDDKISINLKNDGNKYFLEYEEKGRNPYLISKDFETKDEALRSLFGTSEYEILRDRTLFKLDKGTCIYLKDNKSNIRLNSFKTDKLKFTTTTFNNARKKILLESLEKNPTMRKQVIDKTMKHFNIAENREIDFKITNGLDKAKETISSRLQSDSVNKAKTEIKNDSHAFLEGFLGFYGVELNKKLDETKQPFEVVGSNKGYSISKCNRKGELTKISPYFTKNEAEKKLEEVNNYLKIQNKRKLNKGLKLNQEVEK